MPTTDRGLDIALARALGWQDYQDEDGYWYILEPDGAPSRGASTAELAWVLFGPRFQLDWAGLGLLVEAMRQRGWTWHVRAYPPVPNLGLPVTVSWGHSVHISAQATGTDIPHESALAAARALGLAVEE